MAESSLKLLTTLIEEGKLTCRELVEVVGIRANEVREDRTRDDSVLMFQSVNQLIHILLWVKAQSVHTRIELNMNREARDTLLLCCLYECIHESETIHLWLKVVVE